MRQILNRGVLLKKAIKAKENLGDCHSPEEPKMNGCGILGQEKDIGESKRNLSEVWTSVDHVSIPVHSL
jgi:hypothetical protein